MIYHQDLMNLKFYFIRIFNYVSFVNILTTTLRLLSDKESQLIYDLKVFFYSLFLFIELKSKNINI